MDQATLRLELVKPKTTFDSEALAELLCGVLESVYNLRGLGSTFETLETSVSFAFELPAGASWDFLETDLSEAWNYRLLSRDSLAWLALDQGPLSEQRHLVLSYYGSPVCLRHHLSKFEGLSGEVSQLASEDYQAYHGSSPLLRELLSQYCTNVSSVRGWSFFKQRVPLDLDSALTRVSLGLIPRLTLEHLDRAVLEAPEQWPDLDLVELSDGRYRASLASAQDFLRASNLRPEPCQSLALNGALRETVVLSKSELGQAALKHAEPRCLASWRELPGTVRLAGKEAWVDLPTLSRVIYLGPTSVSQAELQSLWLQQAFLSSWAKALWSNCWVLSCHPIKRSLDDLLSFD